MQQITTITFFKFSSFIQKVWAFKMMGMAPGQLKRISGLQFFKLMGSGRKMGFHPAPDWSTYCLLAVWESKQAAETFFKTSPLYQSYIHHSVKHWTLSMRALRSTGTWSGQTPFESVPDSFQPGRPVAVITRATIRFSRLLSFWRYVPTSQKPLAKANGLLFSKGIGEVPITQMATFSLWKDFEAVKQFAYRSEEHREALRKTKSLNWYSEEMFTRFQPFMVEGSWDGVQF